MLTMETDLPLGVFEDKYHPPRHQISRQKRSRPDYQIETPVPIGMVVLVVALEIYLFVVVLA
jgi:hypothetical protein